MGRGPGWWDHRREHREAAQLARRMNARNPPRLGPHERLNLAAISEHGKMIYSTGRKRYIVVDREDPVAEFHAEDDIEAKAIVDEASEMRTN